MGITSVEMAKRLEISSSALSFIETGRRKAQKKLLGSIAREYGIDIEEVKNLWIADVFVEAPDDDEESPNSNLFPLLEVIVREAIDPITKADLDTLIRTQAMLPKQMTQQLILLLLQHRKG